MIEPRKRDTTADAPDWIYLGEFFRGIGGRDSIRLAVYRHIADHALHRLTCDEQTTLVGGPAAAAALAIVRAIS